MAITLPSAVDASVKRLPARVSDNVVNRDEGYARWWKYPTSANGLRSMIEWSFDARTSRTALIDNTRSRRLKNAVCE